MGSQMTAPSANTSSFVTSIYSIRPERPDLTLFGDGWHSTDSTCSGLMKYFLSVALEPAFVDFPKTEIIRIGWDIIRPFIFLTKKTEFKDDACRLALVQGTVVKMVSGKNQDIAHRQRRRYGI